MLKANKTDLERFTKSYIEAMLWSSTDDDGEGLDASESFDGIAPVAMKAIEASCLAFFVKAGDLIESEPNQTVENAGYDFFLTRAGHGCGFWDGDWPVSGDALSAIVDDGFKYRLSEPYIGDDRLLYLCDELDG